jgi:N-methylhydantoinase B
VLDALGRPDPEHAGTATTDFGFQTGKLTGIVLQPGDGIRIVCGGGGGWGDPLVRDPQAVLTDVTNELYSASVVRDLYGVVVEEGAVDNRATVELRRELSAAREADRWRVPVACATGWTV